MERQKGKIRTAYFIIASILLIAGSLTAVFPFRMFSVMQYLAAVAVIAIGICHFIAFASMTYYFRDYVLLLPFVSALALNYILAAYLIIAGAALLIEAAGMHKINM